MWNPLPIVRDFLFKSDIPESVTFSKGIDTLETMMFLNINEQNKRIEELEKAVNQLIDTVSYHHN